MQKITIFTPTYNRAYILENAYNSLKNQSDKNFVWMIIDDGSTDDTELLVNKWIKENVINIDYHKIKNGGKANAFNYAINKTTTEYFLFALDSDDIIVDNGVKLMNEVIKKNDYNIYSFINQVSSTKFEISHNIEDIKNKSFFECLNDDLINGETVNLFKTNYLKNFSFPVIENEIFFTEAYIYYQMNCPVYWTNIILEKATYLDDGLTNNTVKLFVKYPKSWYLYNKLRLEKSHKLKKTIKYTIYLISFGLLSNSKNILKDSKNKLLTIILFPLGFFGKIYLIRKAR